ncbi:hypothetical protein LEMA_P030310.1 [Plenodomus lingam JN3]|uniref:Cyclase n=1 Tax=Leptosphaeria maculans (strain JN3 / isolate v23.1.3 / race Av1-4-5-6-7-8) TaxID=985895 RepID=E4ZWA3_LEPMJ|nr:hypothetical protein LEMA_P030310.1 [Plenodomus lingam JN3]CBX95879.1 hypothetical protein LEMA_P030310.1 [Plenodomus lingam JN3]
MSSPTPRPPFSALPLDKNGPPLNAWGLYGPSDELGALNTLTPATTLLATSEIQTGERISLDWTLNLPSHPSFNRPSILSLTLPPPPPPPQPTANTRKSHPDGTKRTVNDDHLNMNTQGSSQWDGFRHYGYQKAQLYYGGRTQQDLESGDVIGINRVVERGGIVGRGVVLDYPRYLESKGRGEVYALQAVSIKIEELEEMLSETGVEVREGDILLLRTGFTRDYIKLGVQERRKLAEKPPAFIGVESSPRTLSFLWSHPFAAVASDSPSFEMSPLVGPHTAPGGLWAGEPWELDLQGGGLLHQVLLAGWGVMIGEMWDLEAVCERCAGEGAGGGKGRKRRSTCWVGSMPLKVPGGVASPPNAVAIF